MLAWSAVRARWIPDSACVGWRRRLRPGSAKPEIYQHRPGSQFTSGDFTGMLAAAGIRISMGRRLAGSTQRVQRVLAGAARRGGHVDLKGYADGREARHRRMAGHFIITGVRTRRWQPDADDGLARRCRQARSDRRGCGSDVMDSDVPRCPYPQPQQQQVLVASISRGRTAALPINRRAIMVPLTGSTRVFSSTGTPGSRKPPMPRMVLTVVEAFGGTNVSFHATAPELRAAVSPG